MHYDAVRLDWNFAGHLFGRSLHYWRIAPESFTHIKQTSFTVVEIFKQEQALFRHLTSKHSFRMIREALTCSRNLGSDRHSFPGCPFLTQSELYKHVAIASRMSFRSSEKKFLQNRCYLPCNLMASVSLLILATSTKLFPERREVDSLLSLEI